MSNTNYMEEMIKTLLNNDMLQTITNWQKHGQVNRVKHL